MDVLANILTDDLLALRVCRRVRRKLWTVAVDGGARTGPPGKSYDQEQEEHRGMKLPAGESKGEDRSGARHIQTPGSFRL